MTVQFHRPLNSHLTSKLLVCKRSTKTAKSLRELLFSNCSKLDYKDSLKRRKRCVLYIQYKCMGRCIKNKDVNVKRSLIVKHSCLD